MSKEFTFYMSSDNQGNAIFTVAQGELSHHLANNLKRVTISDKEERQAVKELLKSIIGAMR